ncbi:MAG: TlpA disulfide reductase family protein [Saprospiraceae bacterium]
MRPKKLIFIISLFSASIIYSQKPAPKYFTLEGNVKNDFSGYIQLEYENKIDSCLITNNHFTYKGVYYEEISSLVMSVSGKPSGYEGIYIDSEKIIIDLTIRDQKRGNGNVVTNLTVESVQGSKTTQTSLDYRKFSQEHYSDKDINEQMYKRVNEIIEQNPKSPFGASLLTGLSSRKNVDIDKLKKIYSKLDKEYIHEMNKKVIESYLFRENYVQENDLIFDFELPDHKDQLFSTKSLKGKWFLIDFWASWCGPCKEQLPELKKKYDAFKNKNFEVLGVSLDENIKPWLDAIKKENLNWINVIENKDFYGTIASKYNILEIPSNFLVNPEGKIVKKNISIEELENILSLRN